MSAYNELTLLLACTCESVGRRIVQFSYGHVWQHGYAIGSRVAWGPGAVGSDSDEIVAVQGWLTRCNECSNEGDIAVVVRKGVIVGVASWDGIADLADEELRLYPVDG